MIIPEVLQKLSPVSMYEALIDIIHDYVWSPDEEEYNEDQ